MKTKINLAKEIMLTGIIILIAFSPFIIIGLIIMALLKYIFS